MTLYIAGENINAESSVIIATDGKVYAAGSRAGVMIGEAVENIREGFRVEVKVGRIREDDA